MTSSNMIALGEAMCSKSTRGVSTDSINGGVFASTIQSAVLDGGGDDPDDTAIERSCAEINRPSAPLCQPASCKTQCMQSMARTWRAAVFFTPINHHV